MTVFVASWQMTDDPYNCSFAGNVEVFSTKEAAEKWLKSKEAEMNPDNENYFYKQVRERVVKN